MSRRDWVAFGVTVAAVVVIVVSPAPDVAKVLALVPICLALLVVCVWSFVVAASVVDLAPVDDGWLSELAEVGQSAEAEVLTLPAPSLRLVPALRLSDEDYWDTYFGADGNPFGGVS